MKRKELVDIIKKLNDVIDWKDNLSKADKALRTARNYLNVALLEYDKEHEVKKGIKNK
jgi:hypothetical protein